MPAFYCEAKSPLAVDLLFGLQRAEVHFHLGTEMFLALHSARACLERFSSVGRATHRPNAKIAVSRSGNASSTLPGSSLNEMSDRTRAMA